MWKIRWNLLVIESNFCFESLSNGPVANKDEIVEMWSKEDVKMSFGGVKNI